MIDFTQPDAKLDRQNSRPPSYLLVKYNDMTCRTHLESELVAAVGHFSALYSGRKVQS